MLKLSALVEKNAELLGTIETWDNGKPYSVAVNEDVAEVAGTLKYCEWHRPRCAVGDNS